MSKICERLIRSSLDKSIAVKLSSGEVFEGKLKLFDGHLNFLLELSDGFIFIRGSSVVYIRLADAKISPFGLDEDVGDM